MRRFVVFVLSLVVALAFGPPAFALTDTSTTLTASPSPSVFGEEVTLTAIVSPSPGSGMVSYRDGATLLGSTGIDARGKSTLNVTLSVGAHSLTATFDGDLVYRSSTSPAVTQFVDKATTVTSLSASPNPAEPGETITITAYSTSHGSGSVEFSGVGPLPVTKALDATGHSHVTTSFLTPGAHTVVAQYLGNSSYYSSYTNMVVWVKEATSTTLTVSPNPTTWGSPIGLQATVTPSGATGIVQFRRDDGTILGQCPLSGGTCTFVTSALPAGSDPLTALYVGDDTHKSSLGARTAEVARAPSTTTLQPATGSWGAPITLTAHVTAAGATGTVQFTQGATVLGSSAVNAGGDATLAVSGLPVGTHRLTASFSGSVNVLPSAGDADIVVAQAQTSLALSAAGAVQGQTATISATVTPESATGAVTFTEGGGLLGACTLDQGTCTVSTRNLSAGEHFINGAFSGDGQHAPSAASVVVRIAARAVVARAKAVAHKSKLKVTISPPCEARYSFGVETRIGTKWVKRAKTYRTVSTGKVNLPKGTYRAVVVGACGHGGVTTRAVTLKR